MNVRQNGIIKELIEAVIGDICIPNSCQKRACTWFIARILRGPENENNSLI